MCTPEIAEFLPEFDLTCQDPFYFIRSYILYNVTEEIEKKTCILLVFCLFVCFVLGFLVAIKDLT